MEIYRGLVLAERSAGEQGKFIDVLTEHNTVQEIYVRGAKKNSSAGLSATQLFSYATFSVQKRRNQWYLDSAEPIRIFYRLRESLSRLSLAMYFGELIRLSVREHQTPEENCFVMRLMLNTLHYLESGQRSEALLKPIFGVPPDFANSKISHPELFPSIGRMMINSLRRGRSFP